jgi:hypothetical protein
VLLPREKTQQQELRTRRGRGATRTCGAGGAVRDPGALEALPDLVDVLVVAATCAPDQTKHRSDYTAGTPDKGGRKAEARAPEEDEAMSSSG